MKDGGRDAGLGRRGNREDQGKGREALEGSGAPGFCRKETVRMGDRRARDLQRHQESEGLEGSWRPG